MAADNWAPYVPDENAPWNLRRVVHLHRRAGFAATWGEIRRDLQDGPQVSIDRVLAGKAATAGVPEEFHKTADLLGESAAPSGPSGPLADVQPRCLSRSTSLVSNAVELG